MILNLKYKLIYFLLWAITSFFCIGVQENKITEPSDNFEEKTPAQIQEQINALLIIQIGKADKGKYPKYFGIDSRNNLRMIIIFHCSMMCDDPFLFLIYENIDEEICLTKKIGEPLYVLDSGNYLGCEPLGF